MFEKRKRFFFLFDTSENIYIATGVSVINFIHSLLSVYVLQFIISSSFF